MKTMNVRLSRETKMLGFCLVVIGLLVVGVVVTALIVPRLPAAHGSHKVEWCASGTTDARQLLIKNPKCWGKQHFKQTGMVVPLCQAVLNRQPPLAFSHQRDGGYTNALIDNDAYRLRL